MNPPIRWVGGKRWLAPTLDAVFRESGKSRIVEPFCGAAALSFYMEKPGTWINDINSQLINLFDYIKAGKCLDIPSYTDRQMFYLLRDLYNTTKDDPKHLDLNAWLMYYISWSSYAGSYRINNRGLCTSTYSDTSYSDRKHPTSDMIELLRSWKITNIDYRLMETTDSDFVFVDPTYINTTTSYHKNPLTCEDDQLEILDWIDTIHGAIAYTNFEGDVLIDYLKLLGCIVYRINGKASGAFSNRAPQILAIRQT